MVKAANYVHTDKAAQVCPMYGNGYYRDAKRKASGKPKSHAARFVDAINIDIPGFQYVPISAYGKVSVPYDYQLFHAAFRAIYKRNKAMGYEFWLIKSQFIKDENNQEHKVMTIFTLDLKK